MTNLDLLEAMTAGIIKTADTDPATMAGKLITYLSAHGWHVLHGESIPEIDLHLDARNRLERIEATTRNIEDGLHKILRNQQIERIAS
ncbi:hypothetical protein [Desulfatitalea tepidiphila]|uniref:hypothetical protein n=1 Tax=Desulfatitalea tepidiphila TaxID=1185843 RepID=UPI00128EADB5|nr:hypothetical protein [Desulfatitalea tepidiphila]